MLARVGRASRDGMVVAMVQTLGRFGDWALPIGVDIGGGGAKLAQLSHGRSGLRVVSVRRVESEADGSLDALVSSIGVAIRSGVFRGRRCVVSVGDELVRTRAVRHPLMEDSELASAVALDAPQRLGFGVEESCEVGWLRAGQVVQGDDRREEVIYLGAPSDRLRTIALGLDGCGVRVDAIEPSLVGIARCFGRSLRRAEDREVVRLIVDVGLRATGVLITRGRGVAFHRVLELGGESLTRAAAERLGLEREAVEDLRRRRMVGGARGSIDAKVDRAMFDAVRGLMGDIAHEVNLCLRHYSVTFRGSRPSACLVIGGNAGEPGLAEALGEALHMSAEVGDPFFGVGVPARVGLAAGRAHAEWACAVGLSIRPLDRRRGGVRRARERWAEHGDGVVRGAA